jgi:hypothetical protein
MDFELMFTSFPKLLGATVITLKLISGFIIFWFVYWALVCNFKIE